MRTRGSIAWTAATFTASYLKRQAKLVVKADIQSDEEFSFIIAHAIKYGWVEPDRLGTAFGGNEEMIRRWATDVNVPAVEVRQSILNWIAGEMLQRVDAIETLIKKRVKALAE